MRLGQAVMIPVDLVSDSEIRFALIPLTDAELQNSLMVAAQGAVSDTPSTHEVFYRDRVQKCAIIQGAARHLDNLDERVFESFNEVLMLDSRDIAHVFDAYQEMMDVSSPSLDGLTEAEMDEIKKALLEMDWNVLSGRQWYAAKRFLMSLQPQQLPDNSLGSLQTKSSTTKNEEDEFISAV